MTRFSKGFKKKRARGGVKRKRKKAKRLRELPTVIFPVEFLTV